jgi:hypothetical protein
MVWLIKDFKAHKMNGDEVKEDLSKGQIPRGNAKMRIRFFCGYDGCEAKKTMTATDTTNYTAEEESLMGTSSGNRCSTPNADTESILIRFTTKVTLITFKQALMIYLY